MAFIGLSDIEKLYSQLLMYFLKNRINKSKLGISMAVAAVKKEIEDELDRGLPKSYDGRIYEEKCNIVFQHIYDSYAGDNQSIFEATA